MTRPSQMRRRAFLKDLDGLAGAVRDRAFGTDAHR
jgi:hypothetical protein